MRRFKKTVKKKRVNNDDDGAGTLDEAVGDGETQQTEQEEELKQTVRGKRGVCGECFV